MKTNKKTKVAKKEIMINKSSLRISRLLLRLIIIIGLIWPISNYIKANSSCDNATFVGINNSCQDAANYQIADSVGWYYFVANADSMSIGIEQSDSSQIADINSITLYSGACNNLTQIISSNTTLKLTCYNLVIGNSYYIKIKKGINSGYFKLYVIDLHSFSLSIESSCMSTHCEWTSCNPPSCQDFSECLVNAPFINIIVGTDYPSTYYLVLNMGNGTIINPANGSYSPIYTAAGVYYVSLELFDQNGLSIGLITQKVIILDPGTAGLTSSQSLLCPGELLTINASPGWSYYEINWGDGNITTPVIPNSGTATHSYSICGSFVI